MADKKYPVLYATSIKGTIFTHCGVYNTIYFNIYNNKELVRINDGLCAIDDIFKCHIDLLSQYHILQKRNYPNLPKDYAKNFITLHTGLWFNVDHKCSGTRYLSPL